MKTKKIGEISHNLQQKIVSLDNKIFKLINDHDLDIIFNLSVLGTIVKDIIKNGSEDIENQNVLFEEFKQYMDVIFFSHESKQQKNTHDN